MKVTRIAIVLLVMVMAVRSRVVKDPERGAIMGEVLEYSMLESGENINDLS